jgi:hypothetical protein
MKQTKIYVGRDLIGRFTCDGRKYTKFQIQMFYAKRAAKRTLTVAAIIVTAGWILAAGMYYAKSNIKPEVAWAKEIVEVPVKVIPPILKKIAKCESGGSHLKNGQVVINATQDAGKYQINLPVWSKTASSMGLNLMVEADNEKFAMYLFENYGTEPWSASRGCWSK